MLLSEPNLRSSYAAAFAAALIDPDRGTPAVVTGPSGKAAIKRYNVYRNNVTVSLIEAVAAIYPAVQRITGVAFFRAMARAFVHGHKPRSPVMIGYGEEFPEFMVDYLAAAEVGSSLEDDGSGRNRHREERSDAAIQG